MTALRRRVNLVNRGFGIGKYRRCGCERHARGKGCSNE
jgi:hypothetical protein